MSIIEKYLKFCDWKTQEDISDGIHDFIGDLSRWEIVFIIEWYCQYEDLNNS